MDTPQHDPRTKSQIKEALYAHLYEPVQRQFKTRIDTLIARNSIAGGFSHRHFVYKGTLYNAENTPPPLKKNRLLPQLHAAMDEYLADMASLNQNELPYVLGFINQVLNSSNAIQDYMSVFPESVHRPLRNLIDTCPCKTPQLSQDRIAQLVERNAAPISMIKQRLVTNLII